MCRLPKTSLLLNTANDSSIKRNSKRQAKTWEPMQNKSKWRTINCRSCGSSDNEFVVSLVAQKDSSVNNPRLIESFEYFTEAFAGWNSQLAHIYESSIGVIGSYGKEKVRPVNWFATFTPGIYLTTAGATQQPNEHILQVAGVRHRLGKSRTPHGCPLSSRRD
ncbi:hypothetical protein RUM43_008818 [Polyplax serrata]|uniref:Uncharacterized protein n=1 Tax=Polyplax serrata TaxID=468196 RepID=A0AAN8S0S0_POLSC